MTDSIAELARLIEEASGFVIPSRGYEQLSAVAREQVALLQLQGVDEYLEMLTGRSDSQEWRRLLGRITVKESYMYRGRAQFAALRGTIMDELIPRVGDQIRVWCAGCARGEESVTLAIEIASHPVLGALEWSILATDVDEDALDDARRGHYGNRAVADVPTDVLETRFTRQGEGYQFDRRLLGRITYRRVNLVDQTPDLGTTPFDVIFLRNVLIYFRPELQRRVISRVEEVLAPHGVLFLGPSESLLQLNATLRPRNLGNCFCYCWPQPTRDATASRPPSVAVHEKGDLPLQTPAQPPPIPLQSGPGSATANDRMQRAVEAVAAGEAGVARELASVMRAEYPENPMGHVVAGWAALQMGEREAAVLAYRAGLYLDPGNSQVRFLLAQALEASGRSGRALKEYRAVLASIGRSGATSNPLFAALGVPDQALMIHACRKKLGLE